MSIFSRTQGRVNIDETNGGIEIEVTGSAAQPAYSFESDPDTGMYRGGTDVLAFSAGGAERLRLGVSSARFSSDLDFGATIGSPFINAGTGSEGNPSYSFTGDSDTGIYRQGIDSIGITCGGTNAMQINAASIFAFNEIRNINGSAAEPAYTFTIDTDTGMYRLGSNSLGLSTGGVLRLRIDESGALRVPNLGGSGTQMVVVDNDGDFSTQDIPSAGLTVSTISTNTTAVAGTHYHVDTSGVTVTLPAGPSIGDEVAVSVDAFTDVVVARNGSNINETAADFDMDVEQSYVLFRYVNATEGWQITSLSPAGGPASSGTVPVGVSAQTVRYNSTNTLIATSNFTNDGTDLAFTGRIRGGNGSSGAPTYSFSGDPDTGMYRIDTNRLGFSTGAALRLEISAAGALLPAANNTQDIGSATLNWDTIHANLFEGEATTATFADLAERYEIDTPVEKGTVVIFGGEKEITESSMANDHRIAGVISTEPAFMMNKNAGADETHPYLALTGRVPCKVIGPVEKGDILVTSNTPGYATVNNFAAPGRILGKALEATDIEGTTVIEVLVNLM